MSQPTISNASSSSSYDEVIPTPQGSPPTPQYTVCIDRPTFTSERNNANISQAYDTALHIEDAGDSTSTSNQEIDRLHRVMEQASDIHDDKVLELRQERDAEQLRNGPLQARIKALDGLLNIARTAAAADVAAMGRRHVTVESQLVIAKETIAELRHMRKQLLEREAITLDVNNTYWRWYLELRAENDGLEGELGKAKVENDGLEKELKKARDKAEHQELLLDAAAEYQASLQNVLEDVQVALQEVVKEGAASEEQREDGDEEEGALGGEYVEV